MSGSGDDPRLVALYDGDNPDGPDHDLYRALADEIGARSIVDLGCGTGLLTVTLATPGRSVTGVDPSVAMIDFARRRPGSDRVRWLVGDSSVIPTTGVDYAVLTGNVAQHILGEDWPRTLDDLYRTLRPGGTLAFESRNPLDRAWLRWPASPTTRSTDAGPLTEWSAVAGPDADRNVTLIAHNQFERTGEDVVVCQVLAFRTRARIEADLQVAGFEIETVWGNWHRSPFTPGDPLMIFRARRDAAGPADR